MPDAGDRNAALLLDTSVAVPLLVADHEHHTATVEEVGERRLGLAGHAAFETFSVLTRLPAPARRSPAAVRDLLADNFPCSRFLGAAAASDLLLRLPGLRIGGGMVYDALVGAAAAEHGITLASRDERAATVYALLGVDLLLLG